MNLWLLQRACLHCLHYVFHRTFAHLNFVIALYQSMHELTNQHVKKSQVTFSSPLCNSEIIWREITAHKQDVFEIIKNNVVSYKQASLPLVITRLLYLCKLFSFKMRHLHGLNSTGDTKYTMNSRKLCHKCHLVTIEKNWKLPNRIMILVNFR